MTKQEQQEQRHNEICGASWEKCGKGSNKCIDFQNGAKWADKHQPQPSIIILPLEAGRETANAIHGKAFKDTHDMEDAIRAAYAEQPKDEWSMDVEDLIDELGIYNMDDFVCNLNDEIYPTDQWVARVFFTE